MNPPAESGDNGETASSNSHPPGAGLTAEVKGLTNLEYLLLYKTNVTDAGVKKLQKALPNCEIYR